MLSAERGSGFGGAAWASRGGTQAPRWAVGAHLLRAVPGGRGRPALLGSEPGAQRPLEPLPAGELPAGAGARAGSAGAALHGEPWGWGAGGGAGVRAAHRTSASLPPAPPAAGGDRRDRAARRRPELLGTGPQRAGGGFPSAGGFPAAAGALGSWQALWRHVGPATPALPD